jgi:hypothetical protein
MTRPLRIEYPDAWYHAMNRGRRGEEIFGRKENYRQFREMVKNRKLRARVQKLIFQLKKSQEQTP